MNQCVREWGARNKARKLMLDLCRKYQIEPAQYEALVRRAGGACEICGVRFEFKAGFRYPSIDHDHATNKVRGILCSKCNLGLEKFSDSIESLLAAVAYLRRARRVGRKERPS